MPFYWHVLVWLAVLLSFIFIRARCGAYYSGKRTAYGTSHPQWEVPPVYRGLRGVHQYEVVYTWGLNYYGPNRMTYHDSRNLGTDTMVSHSVYVDWEYVRTFPNKAEAMAYIDTVAPLN